MDNNYEHLLSSEFYVQQIEAILSNSTCSEYLDNLLGHIDENINPKYFLNNILIPDIISETLLSLITELNIDDIENIEENEKIRFNYEKYGKIFPLEFLLSNINKLELSFKDYLLGISKSLDEIDDNDIIEYMIKIKVSDDFNSLLNTLSEETSTRLLNNKNIFKQLIDILPGERHFFKPRARLLLQLGDQLIKDEGVALFELIKNSYDADATYSNVHLEDIDKKDLGSITIKDNGSGMNYQLIIEHWLEPGTDYKKGLVERKIRSNIYNRLPLGEKGIGRFGSHKLGQEIVIYSKTDFNNEVEINIDWKDFQEEKYLDNVPISIMENKTTPKYFKKSINSIPLLDYNNLLNKIEKKENIDFLNNLYILKDSEYILKQNIQNNQVVYKKLKEILNLYNYFTSGTYIKITNLWENWSRGMIRSTFRAVNAINSPFENNMATNFKVNISTNKEDWLDKLLTTKDAIKNSLFKVNGFIEKDIINLTYIFEPLENMNKVDYRKITKEIQLEEKTKIFDHLKQKYINELTTYSFEDYGIGKINFEFYIYDLGNEIKQFIKNDLEGLRFFLKQNGGIRIYRDKIRVYDYGEPGNDWLNLDFKRVSNPTQRISNNQLLGAIYLDRENTKPLIEKTNREGFLINEAYEKFAQSISQLIAEIATERSIDKGLIKHHYGPKNSQEPVISCINELSTYVDKNIKDEAIKNNIKKQLLEIEDEYATMTENLLSAASSGLTMNIAIHEIEKVVYELIKRSDQNEFDKDVKLLIKNLHNTILTYSSMAKINKDEEVSLKDIIQKSQDVNFFRLALHGITFINNTVNMKNDIKVKFAEKQLIACLSNLFDNSIYWLERKAEDELKLGNKHFEKKIFIDITYDISKKPTIVVSDNGKGFGNMPTEMARKAHQTNKKYSMGLGLYIIDETMKSNNSRLLFPEKGDISSIPDDIEEAIVALEIGGEI